MNNYFSPSTNNDQQTTFSYDTDYNRGCFSSSFDRLTLKDPRMGTYSNFNMMQAAAAASVVSTSHPEQHQLPNDYLLPTSNGTSSWKQVEPMSSSMNDMMPPSTMPHQLSSFSMAVTNPMIYYAHSWMRPGMRKMIY
jgi:hypothetical protein